MTEKIAVLLRWGRARAMSSEFDTTSTWLIMRVFRAYTFVSFAVALSSSLGQVLNTLVAGNVLGQVSVAAIGIFGPRVGLYCVLALIGKTFVVDGFIESIRQRKVCQVICDHPRDVEEFIVKKLGRTATLQFGWGAYSGKRVVILTSVLSRREAMKLRLFVRATDPGAFITITSSSEIIGRGFRGVN